MLHKKIPVKKKTQYHLIESNSIGKIKSTKSSISGTFHVEGMGFGCVPTDELYLLMLVRNLHCYLKPVRKHVAKALSILLCKLSFGYRTAFEPPKLSSLNFLQLLKIPGGATVPSRPILAAIISSTEHSKQLNKP